MDKLQEWKKQLEQAQEYGLFFDRKIVEEMIKTIEQQQIELKEAQCRELSYIDDIEQMEGMLSQANERIKEIEKNTRFVEYEKMLKENTAMAQELALIKGEM